VSADAWLTETYFDWLRSECFTEASERREYEGVLRVLHDIPFYWTIWSDDDRVGDALTFRQSDFLGCQTDLDRLDQQWLHDWGLATPSVLEIFLGIARRWNSYFEGPVAYYFGHMFVNMNFDRHPGRVLSSRSANVVRDRLDAWMSHQLPQDGSGGPFPLREHTYQIPMMNVDILMQMNAYSLEHFQ